MDVRRLAREVAVDLSDDWFPDPLNFQDLLAPDSLVRAIQSNVRANRGEYAPTPRAFFDIPKPGFTLRYSLETVIADRAIYHGLVSCLIPIFDRRLSWNAFSHRYDHSPRRRQRSSTFKPSIEAWKHFAGCTRSALTPGSYLVSTDVSNFFEHVQLPRLSEQLDRLCDELPIGREREQARAHISTLSRFLAEWTFERDRGLPQNRDASSFLGNLYLRDVDEVMRNAGYQLRYFRYMDDIRIVCSDHFEARLAIKTLTGALRSLGLSLNAKKTDIIESDDHLKIDECLADSSEMLDRIDILWRKRNRHALFRLWPLLRDRTLELANAGKVETREFKYCMRRIGTLARYKDLHFPPHYYSEVTKAVCEAIPAHPNLTDQYCDYLMSVAVAASELQPIVDFLGDASKSIYAWQNYRLWLLLASKRVDTEQLRQIASACASGEDGPGRAGASLFLGSIRFQPALLTVVQNFCELKSYIGQRLALIAIHELPYGEIRNHVVNVRPDLVGVYRGLRRSAKAGLFVEPKAELEIHGIELHEAAYE